MRDIPIRPIEPLSSDAIARLRGDERFVNAITRMAGAVVDHYQANWLLNRLMNDRGRFILSLFAMDLHYFGGPEGSGFLTAGRLKSLCVEQGICSAGRAGAMVASMILVGLLRVEPGPDRRQKRLVPTPRFIGIHRDRWRSVLAELEDILPLAKEGARRMESEAFMAAHLHAIMLTYCKGMRVLDWAPALKSLVERDAGLTIGFTLFQTARDGVSRLSVSELARRFSVSRAHVLGIIRSAEEGGLLERNGDGAIRVLPLMVEELSNFFACALLVLTQSIATAIEAEEAYLSRAERCAAAAGA